MASTSVSATTYLEERLGVKQLQERDSTLRGILHTEDYETFVIRSDVGDVLHTFQGASIAFPMAVHIGDEPRGNAAKRAIDHPFA